MRARIEKEKGTKDIWDLKQVRGGLVDLEFIAQYLQLVHAARHPGVLSPNTVTALDQPAPGRPAAGRGRRRAAARGQPAQQPDPGAAPVPGRPLRARTSAPDGLKALLARAGEAPDFARLEADLAARQAEVAALFNDLVV